MFAVPCSPTGHLPAAFAGPLAPQLLRSRPRRPTDLRLAWGRPRMPADLTSWCCSVNVVFAGHDHIYERTCPVFRQICQPGNADGSQGGPMYVVIGNAGVRSCHCSSGHHV